MSFWLPHKTGYLRVWYSMVVQKINVSWSLNSVEGASNQVLNKRYHLQNARY